MTWLQFEKFNKNIENILQVLEEKSNLGMNQSTVFSGIVNSAWKRSLLDQKCCTIKKAGSF